MAEDTSGSISEPLKDIIEIVEERPELTQEQWEIVEKAVPWLKAQIKPEVRAELEVEYAKKLGEQLDELKKLNQEHIEKQFAALKKAQEPMGEEDIKKLLSQEYTQFEVNLRIKGEKRQFIVCEQPSAVEEKFYKILKEALVPILQNREAIEFRLNEASLVEKIQIVLETSEKALDLGAQIVATILDPWEEDKDINAHWVRRNISTERQAAIILAQFEANKYRDFFSQGFRTFLNLRR